MESGKISFGFLLLLLIIFGAAAGAGWLAFSGTKTGVGLIDNNVAKLQQAFMPQPAEQLGTHDHPHDHDHDHPHDHPHDHDHDHPHGEHTHSHEESTQPEAANVPGNKGIIFQKPVDPVLGLRAVGDPNAPVQVREFFSLTCNHCAAFHEGTYQKLKTDYIDTGKLYFIFEEFPLNGPALYGSMIARCMPKDRYESFITLLLKNQDKWAFGGDFKSALQQNAALAGMSEEDFEKCFNNKDLQAALAKNIQASSDTWKISSTPSFVFNDGKRVLSGVRSVEDFDKVINFLNGKTPTQPAAVAPTPAPEPAPQPEAPVESAPEPEVTPPSLEDTSININDLYED